MRRCVLTFSVHGQHPRAVGHQLCGLLGHAAISTLIEGGDHRVRLLLKIPDTLELPKVAVRRVLDRPVAALRRTDATQEDEVLDHQVRLFGSGVAVTFWMVIVTQMNERRLPPTRESRAWGRAVKPTDLFDRLHHLLEVRFARDVPAKVLVGRVVDDSLLDDLLDSLRQSRCTCEKLNEPAGRSWTACNR